jgi:hypothetical protein
LAHHRCASGLARKVEEKINLQKCKFIDSSGDHVVMAQVSGQGPFARKSTTAVGGGTEGEQLPDAVRAGIVAMVKASSGGFVERD